MKTAAFCRAICLAALLLWLAPLCACAETLGEALEAQLDTLDLSALTRVESEQTLVEGDLSALLRALVGGQAVLSGEKLVQWLAASLTQTLRHSLWRMTRLLAPSLLVGVLEHLQPQKSGVADACRYAGMLLALGFLAADLKEHVALTQSAVTGMADAMQALFPLLVTLLAAVGGSAAAAFFQPAVVAACGTMTALICDTTLPFAVATAALTMIGCLSPQFRVGRLAKLLQRIAHWTLGVSVTVFIGVTIVQGLGTAAVDGVSIRTAKYALDNFVPIVGSMFADTVDTLVGCSLLIKNAVGVLGLLLMLGRMLSPLLQTVGTMLLYKATSALLEPVADSAICRGVGEFADSFQLLFIIQLSVGAMFLLLVAQMLVVGNLTVMLR